MESTDQLKLSFGDHLRKLRVAQGISIHTLATLADIDYGMLQKIENDKGNPTLKTMRKIARGLNISLAELMQDVV